MEPRNTRHVKNTRPSHPPFFFPFPCRFSSRSSLCLSASSRSDSGYLSVILSPFSFSDIRFFYVLQFLKFTNLLDHLNLLRLRGKENYFQLLLSFSSFKIFSNVNETNNIGKFVICS